MLNILYVQRSKVCVETFPSNNHMQNETSNTYVIQFC